MTKHILTTSVLLLSLFTYTAAQHNIDGFKEWNPRQTLEGVREIALIVKYGRVDGLEKAMQPIVLQSLVARAKELLKQGDVPMLESTNEADMVGKPRLVFTVTVNKQTDAGPPLVIECELFQRVRLWRDPSQEFGLETWSWTTIDPTVNYEKLSTLFDKQVRLFVKEYKAANPEPVENRTTEPATPLKANVNGLQGLSGIDSITTLGFFELVDDRLQPIAETLRTETENKLKQAGIPSLRRPDAERAGYPLLKVEVMLNPQGKSYAWPIQIKTQLWQRVFPVQNSKKYSYLPTWESFTDDASGITEETVLRIVNSQLDRFIEDYKAANPKPAVKTQ